MAQSLKLGGSPAGEEGRGIRRLNRLPLIIAIVLVIVFFAVIFYGLTSRGLDRHHLPERSHAADRRHGAA